MILSVSRRTDIPNYYSEWFFNRVKEGYLYVRNPINAHQISKIVLSPNIVDCIVFWTKNPENMLPRLDELKKYNYYFQFTLTGYGRDIEPGIPNKRKHLISVFHDLSKHIGRERVIWRYDPILINETYTIAYHLKAFKAIAEKLNGYTDKVVISFVDLYAKTKRNTEKLNIICPSKGDMCKIAVEMAQIAATNHMTIESCAEHMDLQECGVKHGTCIDKDLIQNIIGYEIVGNKDKNQREECGCFESVEVGTYNTCKNGCRYCYANYSYDRVSANICTYNVDSPLLCGVVNENDVITERKVKSLRMEQLNFLNLI